MKRLLSATCLFVFSLSPLIAQNKNVQRWEYFQMSKCDLNDIKKYGDDFNKFGEDGWELASVVAVQDSCPRYTFKRPKAANAPKYVEPVKQKAPEKKEALTCQLTFEQAPKFRGIRLGMSVKEMLSLFPGSEQRGEVISRLQQVRKNFGIGEIDFNFEQYGRMNETSALFDNIQSYSFEIIDDRIVSYTVSFSEYRKDIDWRWTLPAWQDKLTEEFHLPSSEHWGKTEINNVYWDLMRCGGFEISVIPGFRSARFTIRERLQSSPSEQVQQRYEAASEKIRQSFKIAP